jgi:hypothetical protein
MVPDFSVGNDRVTRRQFSKVLKKQSKWSPTTR